LVPSERGKGYATEATHIIVDYLFLSKNIVRIEAGTQIENIPPRRLSKSAVSHERGYTAKRCSTVENGLTYAFTAFSEKNGNNQEY
jgi:hypothetical protein